MALRILSGIVNAKRGTTTGSVRIGFNPHRRTRGDAPVIKRRTIGPAGRFVRRPAKIVALRQINVPAGPLSLLENWSRFIVNDNVNRDRLVITWDREGLALVEEVSYLVIGEVPDSQPRTRTRRRR